MSKTVLAGILGGITLATGFLCYTIYQRDKEEDSEEEKESSIKSIDDSTHIKEEINDPLVEEVLITKPIIKKKRSTSRNLSTKKIHTKRNRSSIE